MLRVQLAIAMLTIASQLPAQTQQLADFFSNLPPVVMQIERQGTLWSQHVGGLVTAVSWEATSSTLVASFTDPAIAAAHAQEQDPPLPTITTTWTDANGVTHSVSTPFPGTTQAALRRALEQHNMLVQLQQGLHPPAPPPPPPLPKAPVSLPPIGP